MKKLLLCGLLLLVTGVASGQYKAFEHIGGPTPTDLKKTGTTGAYVQARQLGTTDTLKVWVQDVGNITPPNYLAALAADMVVWCFPKNHPHPRHAMPDARRVAVKGIDQSPGGRYFLLVDLSRAEIPKEDQLRRVLSEAARRK